MNLKENEFNEMLVTILNRERILVDGQYQLKARNIKTRKHIWSTPNLINTGSENFHGDI